MYDPVDELVERERRARRLGPDKWRRRSWRDVLTSRWRPAPRRLFAAGRELDRKRAFDAALRTLTPREGII